jgi:IS30 family transposase
MSNHKHLTEDDRSKIHTWLNIGNSFRQIAILLDKDPSTISKEVRLHRIPMKDGSVGSTPNDCAKRLRCRLSGICEGRPCLKKFCRDCKLCNSKCPEFLEDRCPQILKPPYVCNPCKTINRCSLRKYFYRAISAHKSYLEKRTESRSGLSFTEEDLRYIDSVISPLIQKKQSVHHICVTQVDRIQCSERTIYNLIDKCVFSVRNIDLPRKVRYRQRRKNKPFKVDKGCRIGRNWQDFQAYLNENPDMPVVQMDTVEGNIGGKVLLTIFFTQSDLMLIFLRERNTSQSVIDIFNSLYETLGRDAFMQLFPLILTDNGSEFSNPKALESDAEGQMRTRLFYCDPSSPHQKAEIERNHELIRMILPKGRPFDNLTQDDADLMASHINCLIRKKLNNLSPTTLFSFFHGDVILLKLGLRVISPDELTLAPELLSASKEANKLGKDL